MKNIVIGFIAVVALILGAYAISHQMSVQSGKDGQSVTGPQGPQGKQGPAGAQGVRGAQGMIGPKGDSGMNGNLGSAPGSSVSTNDFQIGGLTRIDRNQSISQATSTLCSLLSPSGTSTLMYANLQVKIGTSSAVLAYLATSTTKYAAQVLGTATTTVLAQAIVAANAAPLLTYLPTATANAGVGFGVNATSTALTTQIAPNTYVIWAAKGGGIVETGGVAGSVFAGTCTAEFLQTN